MGGSRKHSLAFYGTILSAVHFTAAALLTGMPLLMLRFEDMVGSGDTKPYWPPSRFRDAVEAAGDILASPAKWVVHSCPRMPDLIVLLVAMLSSCLWGFGLALVVRLLLNRLRVSHEPRPA